MVKVCLRATNSVFVIKCASRWMLWMYKCTSMACSLCTTTCTWNSKLKERRKKSLLTISIPPTCGFKSREQTETAEKKKCNPFTWNRQIKLKNFICEIRNGSDSCINSFILFDGMCQQRNALCAANLMSEGTAKCEYFDVRFPFRSNSSVVLSAVLVAHNSPDARPKKPEWMVSTHNWGELLKQQHLVYARMRQKCLS